MTSISPKKLLNSKWTACKVVAKQKHFMVTKVIPPELPDAVAQWVEIEAVYSKKVRRIEWRELQDSSIWQQGWQA